MKPKTYRVRHTYTVVREFAWKQTIDEARDDAACIADDGAMTWLNDCVPSKEHAEVKVELLRNGKWTEV